MDIHNALQYMLFIVVLSMSVKPLGGYLERVFSGKRTILDRAFLPIERLIYRITGADPAVEMSPKQYTICFLLFSLAGTLLLYGILRLQHFLPWFFSQYHTTPMTPDLAMNTAISFSTTTTWQAYGGENTMSYFSQMAGLCAQNFLAGAAGLAIGMAFIRGFVRERAATLGNFWFDLTRSLLWVLLPGALVGAALLVAQGVPMKMFGRFALAIPALALAGLFARQLNSPPSAGTLRTDSLAFAVTLTATVLVVAGLSYFPALTLGPILEQLLSK